jgi:hypothetical protein
VRDAALPEGRVVRVRPLRGGISSSVHVVHLQSEAGRRAAVIVRRYGAYAQEHEPLAAEREFALLTSLARAGLPVPTPLLLISTWAVREIADWARRIRCWDGLMSLFRWPRRECGSMLGRRLTPGRQAGTIRA